MLRFVASIVKQLSALTVLSYIVSIKNEFYYHRVSSAITPISSYLSTRSVAHHVVD